MIKLCAILFLTIVAHGLLVDKKTAFEMNLPRLVIVMLSGPVKIKKTGLSRDEQFELERQRRMAEAPLRAKLEQERKAQQQRDEAESIAIIPKLESIILQHRVTIFTSDSCKYCQQSNAATKELLKGNGLRFHEVKIDNHKPTQLALTEMVKDIDNGEYLKITRGFVNPYIFISNKFVGEFIDLEFRQQKVLRRFEEIMETFNK